MCTHKETSGVGDRLMKAAEEKAERGENIDKDLRKISEHAGDDLSNNANPFVPWSDPQIPFECSCGKIIYADTVHSHDD